MNIDILDAGHGDCLLVTCGETLILVDSGPKSLKVRKALIQRLKNILQGKDIDLAIVTHNDDDHIGAFKYIIDSGIVIKAFIFNSLELVAKIFRDDAKSKKISFRQDIQLQNLLKDLDINVCTFKHEDALVNFNGITLTPLTPDEIILSKLHSKAEKVRKNKKITSFNRVEPSISSCLKDIKEENDTFVEDSSITNKSSISFVLEFVGTRALFLGDSHPTDVIHALKCKNQVDKPFNVVKISHHASEKNTNRELLELIGKSDYIICADKSHHGHPNNKTISRIIDFDQSAKFHISGDNEKIRTVFLECVELGFPISVTYPSNGVNRVTYE